MRKKKHYENSNPYSTNKIGNEAGVTMEKSIYRQAAIDRLASPEDLEGRLVITAPRNFIFIVACFLLVLAIILWSIIGHIPVKIMGTGLLIPSDGLYQITYGESGKITNYFVRSGDYVKEGQLIAQLKTNSAVMKDEIWDIVATEEGRILELYNKKFEYYEKSMPFALIARESPSKSDLTMKMYITSIKGKQVKPGMDVHVSPTTVKVEEYGFLKGRVTKVSEYPVSNRALLDTLENESIVNEVLENGPVLEVEVELIKSNSTISGYAWSTPKGPDEGLDSGVFCYGAVIVGQRRPISYVIPTVK